MADTFRVDHNLKWSDRPTLRTAFCALESIKPYGLKHYYQISLFHGKHVTVGKSQKCKQQNKSRLTSIWLLQYQGPAIKLQLFFSSPGERLGYKGDIF